MLLFIFMFRCHLVFLDNAQRQISDAKIENLSIANRLHTRELYEANVFRRYGLAGFARKLRELLCVMANVDWVSKKPNVLANMLCRL